MIFQYEGRFKELKPYLLKHGQSYDNDMVRFRLAKKLKVNPGLIHLEKIANAEYIATVFDHPKKSVKIGRMKVIIS